MRKLEYDATYVIPHRGLVRAGREPDPPFQLRETIEVDGVPHMITGLERHPIAGFPRPGMPVGVLAVPTAT